MQNLEVPTVDSRTPKTRGRVPRILYISWHWPHKVSNASEQRAFHVRRALQQVGKVDVVVLDVEGGSEDWVETVDDNYKIVEVIKVQSHENKGIYEKLRWALDPRSYYPQGRAVDSVATNRILQLLEQYDLIWFAHIRAASMFPHWAWPRSVLDIDDMPSAFETSVLQSGCGFREQVMTRLRRASWRRREKLLADRFTTLVVCSENDRWYMRSMGITASIHVIPNGSEKPAKEPIRTPSTPPRIGFIGIFDYFPNLEGIEWFLSQCWPRIQRERPDAELRLAGRNADTLLKVSGPNISRLGWVEDVDPEIATWSLMIVPIHKGAGTRAKIVLGFSRKCPIVSTSLGAFGYEVRNEEEILLADTPEAFADACLRVIQQPAEAAAMAERAREKFLEKWTWEAIQPRIWAAAEDCLRRGANSPIQTT